MLGEDAAVRDASSEHPMVQGEADELGARVGQLPQPARRLEVVAPCVERDADQLRIPRKSAPSACIRSHATHRSRRPAGRPRAGRYGRGTSLGVTRISAPPPSHAPPRRWPPRWSGVQARKSASLAHASACSLLSGNASVSATMARASSDRCGGVLVGPPVGLELDAVVSWRGGRPRWPRRRAAHGPGAARRRRYGRCSAPPGRPARAAWPSHARR